MVKQTIQIFVRVKPTKSKKGLYEIDEDSQENPRISFTVPKDLASGLINNKKESYKFRFEKIFDQQTQQDEIFESVARPVIDNVLEGYNGTIFAYGQTGSGKTFTITGGPEKYSDRGIIPRSLSYIFQHYEQNSELEYTTYVSYLEIYNDSGYDLLDPKHEAAKLEDLPKVALMEDADQNIHLKNLSTHTAASEEDALNLLFLGDTNRMIAETPMNQASTRSHCIFTIHIMSRETGSATVKRSKLHLVDLAGSERVSKTGVNGVLLTEAKYINLSLHYLEQVIVALGEKNRQHVPYRNSMMTSVLRDSLGGNCMTTMIATCSVEKKNIDETISTCRFAQRVALIKNDAILNEELDPKLLILKLKKEIQGLKEELSMATGEQRNDALTEEELKWCEQIVNQYIDDKDPEAVLSVGADMRKIQQCFGILKRHVVERPPAESSPSNQPQRDVPFDRDGPSVYDDQESKKLKGLILQRDNEISILVNMLKKEKKRAADAISQLEAGGHDGRSHSASVPRPPSSRNILLNGSSSDHLSKQKRSMSEDLSNKEQTQRRPPSARFHKDPPKDQLEEKTKAKILGDLSLGRQEAFEIFRRDYNENQSIDGNKVLLKQRYGEAKTLGERVNKSRSNINKVKAQIEQHRMSLMMQGLVDPDNAEPDEKEQQLRHQMEEDKAIYKESFARLRALKAEIEHLQHLLENHKVKLMKDFEIWWAEQAASVEAHQKHVHNMPGKTKAAWKTPPITPQLEGQSRQSSMSSESSSSLGYHRPPIPAHVRQSIGLGSAKASNNYDNHRGDSSKSMRSTGASSDSASSINLTGDPRADADIMAFVKARQNILKQVQGNR
ncbi:kinesin-like protein KIF6 [Lineus longissimus]|uniref:kinesin-like protein KIF6 n=1 Tax=Lineus longissimus TaxID=88925 RepID=UPI00315CAC5E